MYAPGCAGHPPKPGAMDESAPQPAGLGPPSSGVVRAAAPDEKAPGPLLRWPPPELEGLQGESWRLLVEGAVGAGLLVIPLLWTVARDQPFWSLGPFGERWWILVVVLAAALAILGGFFWRAVLALRTAARGADGGYGLRLLLQVAADQRRDTGFLIQGARYYAGLGPGTRRGVLNLRLWGVHFYLVAVSWVPVGWTLALLFAARGSAASEEVAWMVALAPAAVLAVAGMACRTAEETTVRRARRAWFKARAREGSLGKEAEEWNRDFQEGQAPEALGIGDRGAAGSFRMARAGVLLLAAVVAIPIVTLGLTEVIGPVVASVGLPSLPTVQTRMASVPALRPLGVEADPGISPREAGEALNVILYVGGETPRSELELPPVRRYDDDWIPRPPEGVPGRGEPRYFAEDLIGRWAAGEIGPEEWTYLRRVASHPAHEELSLLARAPGIDVTVTRWRLPLPDTVTVPLMPIPRLAGLRKASYARVARAVVAAEDGRLDEADMALREVVSAGVLLADEGPTLLDNLVGVVVARTASRSLEDLYRATGRGARADRLAWALASADTAAAVLVRGSAEPSPESRLREMPELVLAGEGAPGLRWERFFLTNTVASCLNLHTAVFGPGEAYGKWLAAARTSLVHGPGDEALFELGRRGYLGAASRSRLARTVGGFFALTLGAGSDTGSCSVLITGLD